jgi:hypothetical protein
MHLTQREEGGDCVRQPRGRYNLPCLPHQIKCNAKHKFLDDFAPNDRGDRMFGFECVAAAEKAWKNAPSLHMGMLIVAIRNLDLKSSTFDCKFILKKVWMLSKSEMTADGDAEFKFLETNSIFSSLPGQENHRSYKLAVLQSRMRGDRALNYNNLKIPEPSYMNGISVRVDEDILFVHTLPQDVNFEQHTTSYGTFHEEYSLHHFPYDVQSLHIEIRLRRRDIFQLKRHHLSIANPLTSVFNGASSNIKSSKDRVLVMPVVFHPRYYMFHWKTHRPITGINYVCKVLSNVAREKDGKSSVVPVQVRDKMATQSTFYQLNLSTVRSCNHFPAFPCILRMHANRDKFLPKLPR